MNEPIISIIIPTYNRVHLIGETLNSVLLQTYTNWECVVVDDGSSDYTNRLMEFYSLKDSRIKYFHRPNNRPKGANACRNFGLKMSSGQYIVWFDSDDIMNPDYLKKGVERLVFNKDIDFVFFNYQIYEETPFRIIESQTNKSISPLEDYFSGEINFSTCGVIWRRKNIKACFNEKLKKTQELNFFFKNYILNPELSGSHIDHFAFLLRKHVNSIVNNYKIGNPDYLLSDVYVRKEIMDYFPKQKYSEIWKHQKEEYKRGLSLFFQNASINDIFMIFYSQMPFNKLVQLFLFRKLASFTGRDYRLKKLISDLSNRNYKIKLA